MAAAPDQHWIDGCAWTLLLLGLALLALVSAGAPLPDWLLPVRGRWKRPFAAGIALLFVGRGLYLIPDLLLLVAATAAAALAGLAVGGALLALDAWLSRWERIRPEIRESLVRGRTLRRRRGVS